MQTVQKIFVFEKSMLNPFFQSLIALTLTLLIAGGSFPVKWTGWVDISDRFPWMTAAVFMLCFAVFNSLLSLKSENNVLYFGRSVYAFLGLAAGSGVMAFFFSGLTIGEAGSYRWIFIVVTISYLIFLTMVNLMKKIVDFAMKEEWNQPRLKK